MPRTARNLNTLTWDLRQAAGGANTNAGTVILLQNNEAAILATLEVLMGRSAAPDGSTPLVKGVVYEWNEAKVAKFNAGLTYTVAVKAGRELALTCVSTLKTALGRQWNGNWNAAGFTNGSLRIPKKPGGILTQLAGYYAANPTRQVVGVNGFDCTSLACQAAVQAIDDARGARNVARGAAVRAKRAYNAGLKAARQRLIGLRAELSQLLPPNDPRWLGFGLERPAYRATPAIPEDLTGQTAGTGALYYRWEDSLRADNYRFVLKDTAGKVLLEKLVNENSISVTNLPTGIRVTGEVSARNKTGESRATAPVSATVE